MSDETDLQRAILETLRALGLTVWRNQSGTVRVRGGFMHMAPEGTPDIIGYLADGRLLGIEVKLPGKEKRNTKPERREKQAAWRAKARAAGCVVGQVTSVGEAVLLVRGAMAETRRTA